MAFDIELKEDSPEKLAAVAGKPTKYYLSAPELMALIDYINGLDLQQILEVGGSSTLGIEVAGLTLSGKINFVTSLITSLRNVSFPDKDGTVAYLDDITSLLEGLSWKQKVELNLNSGVTMSGVIPTISSLTQQGHTLVNDSRLIVSNAPNPIYNGFYRVNSTPVSGAYRLYRTNDANTSAELTNAVVDVTHGDFKNQSFRQATANPVIGTDNIIFEDFGSSVATATNLIAGITKVYNTLGSNEDGTINQKIISDNFALKLDKGFLDYSSATTTIGWSSFTQKKVYIFDFGTHCLVSFHLVGPGNSINASFTINFTAAEEAQSMLIPMTNGSYLNNPGRGVINSGSSVVSLFSTLPGSTWSAGTSEKRATGFIIIKK